MELSGCSSSSKQRVNLWRVPCHTLTWFRETFYCVVVPYPPFPVPFLLPFLLLLFLLLLRPPFRTFSPACAQYILSVALRRHRLCLHHTSPWRPRWIPPLSPTVGHSRQSASRLPSPSPLEHPRNAYRPACRSPRITASVASPFPTSFPLRASPIRTSRSLNLKRAPNIRPAAASCCHPPRQHAPHA